MGCGGSSLNNIKQDETRNYCYSSEEVEQIDLIINENPNIKDNDIVFYKYLINVGPDGITYKDYITV